MESPLPAHSYRPADTAAPGGLCFCVPSTGSWDCFLAGQCQGGNGLWSVQRVPGVLAENRLTPTSHSLPPPPLPTDWPPSGKADHFGTGIGMEQRLWAVRLRREARTSVWLMLIQFPGQVPRITQRFLPGKSTHRHGSRFAAAAVPHRRVCVLPPSVICPRTLSFT